MTSAVDLGVLFCRHLPAHLGAPKLSVELSAALAHAYQTGRAAWPMLDLAAETFIPYLAERTAAADVEAIQALHLADLYLCCGCALADPRALREFEGRLLPEAAIALVRAGIPPEQRDEVLQQVRVRLFVPDKQGKLHILGYSGRGALISWLRVAAVRIALNLRKSQQRYVPMAPLDELVQVLPGSAEPEFQFLKTAYRLPCREALRAAVATLPDLERTLLYLQYIDRRNIDEIGVVCRISRATAARWLARARTQLLRETCRQLATRLKMTDAEAASLLRDVQSQLLSSLHNVLGPPPASP